MYMYIKLSYCTLQISYIFICKLYLNKVYEHTLILILQVCIYNVAKLTLNLFIRSNIHSLLGSQVISL